MIFGGKIRKGDWIEVESVMGKVTEIYLSATKVQSRDNIKYLVPNSNMIANTMMNYTLCSALIRIEMPVVFHTVQIGVKFIKPAGSGGE